ncbi:MAG: DUF423 domain-containing protein [Planctomycetes bacterium]|nr:DUF423 domain-containing protein [Planctomycetota bacterium]
MKPTTLLRLGAALAGLAVAAGAFGAHGLKATLEPGDLAIFETAVRYQMYHALALLACAALAARGFRIGLAPWALLLGTMVFSGSLYLLVLLDVRWLGAITPIGGVVMIVGWITLATSATATPPQ